MIVVPSLGSGGMERVASALANHLAAHVGIEVHLYTLVGGSPFYDVREEVNLAQCSEEGGLLVRGVRTVRAMRRYLKRHQPTAVLSFGDRYNSLTVLAGLWTGTPVYVSNRQSPQASNGLVVDALNWVCYRGAAGIVAQTQPAAEAWRRRYGHANVRTIPNPFRLPDRRADSSATTVLNVGRFGDKKNQFELIEIFDRCRTHDWDLLFVGDGQKRSETEDYWRRSPKSAKIKFLGRRRDVDDLYCRSSVFAFTSRSEGFPNALGEAMSYGLAVVAYDCVCGPADLIDDGINGFLVAVGDHAAFADRLQQLIDDAGLRERLGSAAREKMKRFGLGRVANMYCEFLLPGFAWST